MTAQRSTVILGACFGLFIVLLPLSLEKPGLPVHVRADEPTYLAMAASLALDGDLRCEQKDVERVFSAFPYSREPTFHLVSGDGWTSTPMFDREPLFAWIAALPVRWLGANGLTALNGLFFLGIVALAAVRRRPDGNEWGPGLVFTAVFLGVSAAFIHVFWLGSALFFAFLIAASLRLAEDSDDRRASRPTTRRIGSGVTFGLAMGALPWLLLIAPSFLVRRRAAVWAAGAVLGTVLAIGSGVVLGISPWNPELESRQITLSSPYELPAAVAADDPMPAFGDRRYGELGDWAMNLLNSLIEQRTGLFPYFPALIVLLALGIFHRRILLSGPREIGLDRLLLGAGFALCVLIQPWVGSSVVGGEAFANPGLVAICPMVLFLLRAVPPAAVTLSSVALGVLTLGPALVSCLGPSMAYGGPQSHTQGAVLSRLPLDLGNVGAAGGYWVQSVGSDAQHIKLWVPRQQAELRGKEAWLLGNTTSYGFLESTERLDSIVLQVRSLASNNPVQVRMGGQREVLDFGEVPAEGSVTRLTFRPEGQRRLRDGEDRWIYPLTVTSRKGKKPSWNGDDGKGFFYLGAAIAYLGTESFLAQSVYGAEHIACEAPDAAPAGSSFLALSTLENTSAVSWPVGGAAEVRLGYRWLALDGSVAHEGKRTDLKRSIAPGEQLTAWLQITAPGRPGSYLLELDPIFENVAWFSAQGVATCRRPVEIVAPLAQS